MFSIALLIAAVSYAHPDQLVDAVWLAAHLTDQQIRILDVRRSGFEEGHVPHSSWLDPESIRDSANTPTYLMPAARFEQLMGELGINNRTRVIVYDDRGGLLASRVWWVLHAYGHSNVALLNGGWVQWTAEKRPSTSSSIT